MHIESSSKVYEPLSILSLNSLWVLSTFSLVGSRVKSKRLRTVIGRITSLGKRSYRLQLRDKSFQFQYGAVVATQHPFYLVDSF